MQRDRIYSRLRWLRLVLALPALALFFAGCKSGETFFSAVNQPAPPVVAPGSSAPPAPSSPFVDYDRVLVGAISNQWFKAVGSLMPKPPVGTVVLAFQLNLNGTINDLQAVESNEAEPYTALCKQAVLDATPFAVWPDDMRQACPDGYRDIRYRFYFK